jgi:hypothetical protein
MKEMFKKSAPSQLALYALSGAIGSTIVSGSWRCWPCFLGTLAAAGVVWFCIVMWAHGPQRVFLPAGKLTAFDKALLELLLLPPVLALGLIGFLVLFG